MFGLIILFVGLYALYILKRLDTIMSEKTEIWDDDIEQHYEDLPVSVRSGENFNEERKSAEDYVL